MIQKLLLSIQMICKMFTKTIDEYNVDKECKILIFFDDLSADMINNKTLSSTITELYIRSRKLNIPLVFIRQ